MKAEEHINQQLLTLIATGLEKLMLQNQVLMNAAMLPFAPKESAAESIEKTKRLYDIVSQDVERWRKANEAVGKLVGDMAIEEITSKYRPSTQS